MRCKKHRLELRLSDREKIALDELRGLINDVRLVTGENLCDSRSGALLAALTIALKVLRSQVEEPADSTGQGVAR